MYFFGRHFPTCRFFLFLDILLREGCRKTSHSGFLKLTIVFTKNDFENSVNTHRKPWYFPCMDNVMPRSAKPIVRVFRIMFLERCLSGSSWWWHMFYQDQSVVIAGVLSWSNCSDCMCFIKTTVMVMMGVLSGPSCAFSGYYLLARFVILSYIITII